MKIMNKTLLQAILDNTPDDVDFSIEIDGYYEVVGQVSFNEEFNVIVFAPVQESEREDDPRDDAPSDEDDNDDDETPSCDVTGCTDTVVGEDGVYKVRDA